MALCRNLQRLTAELSGAVADGWQKLELDTIAKQAIVRDSDVSVKC